MRVVFDLDETARNLSGYLEKKYDIKITQWNGIFKGKTFWEMMLETPEAWEKSKPSKYYKVIRSCSDLEFWTIQPDDKKPVAISWIYQYFPNTKRIRFFKNFKQKYNTCKKENVILIDDYPEFKDYDNIILVDAAYNQHTKAPRRIKKPGDLKRILGERNAIRC